MLDFLAFPLDKKNLLDSYFFSYGEGSCQHSFVSSFCMAKKYGDKFAVKDDFLFILRENRCTKDERVYLFPLGNMENPENVRRAVDCVIEDAHSHGAKVRFETVTENAKNFLSENFSDSFSISENRDVAEYIYDCEKLAAMQGGEYHDRRKHVRKFLETYKDRWTMENITSAHFSQMLNLSESWLKTKMNDDNRTQLMCEHTAIEKSLENWSELGMEGLVLFIDGELKGFIYGMKLNDKSYNAMILKSDKTCVYVSPFLYRSYAEYCGKTAKWVNLEEDLGDAGLRQMKLSYRPDHLLNKYLVKEINTDD